MTKAVAEKHTISNRANDDHTRYGAVAAFACTCVSGASPHGSADPVHPRPVAVPPVLGRSRFNGALRGRVPAGRVSTSAATACRRLRSSQSTTPTPGLWADDVTAVIDQFDAGPDRARRLVLRRLRDLRLRALVWAAPFRGDQLRRRGPRTRRGCLRDVHRPRPPGHFDGRHRRRFAQRTSAAMRKLVRAFLGDTASDRPYRDAPLCWAVAVPAQVRAGLAARDHRQTTTCCSELEVPLLVKPRRRDRRAPGDGRTHSGHVPERRGVLVRRRRARPVPRRARAIQ